MSEAIIRGLPLRRKYSSFLSCSRQLSEHGTRCRRFKEIRRTWMTWTLFCKESSSKAATANCFPLVQAEGAVVDIVVQLRRVITGKTISITTPLRRRAKKRWSELARQE